MNVTITLQYCVGVLEPNYRCLSYLTNPSEVLESLLKANELNHACLIRRHLNCAELGVTRIGVEKLNLDIKNISWNNSLYRMQSNRWPSNNEKLKVGYINIKVWTPEITSGPCLPGPPSFYGLEILHKIIQMLWVKARETDVQQHVNHTYALICSKPAICKMWCMENYDKFTKIKKIFLYSKKTD